MPKAQGYIERTMEGREDCTENNDRNGRKVNTSNVLASSMRSEILE